ncbi:helix-turn-helix transcriptional regulator [Leifsonia flava]|uniref:helix-turn-helix transcriptional regulator n=1 Tax=Orlajensenia leifsoniae TaxID=2561933 RepID=UPI00195A6430|nr:LuxR family transcriptional regulator [Leifsonia flava]
MGHDLIGREQECARLADLVARVRGGNSETLTLIGEAGIGKSALLDYVGDRARGLSVIGVVGVESEMELAYAGVHQLCAPLLEHVDGIPEPQREALTTAFGISSGRTPDRFLVGLAVLSLLSEAAQQLPVICLVDDIQWLDEASIQTIAFVARRLRADAVGIVLAQRDTAVQADLTGLPRLPIRGLSDVDARALLTSVVTGPLDESVRERIVAETGGNPLAIRQLPLGLKSDEMAGGFGLSGLGALSARIEQSFRRRLEPMPAATRRLLLVAAADPGQDAVLIWRAAEQLGVVPADADPAVADEFVSFSGQVRFCHPLARSTVYKSAFPDERRAAHQALADATDPAANPERRAWHRAHASSGPDEDVAAELERSAEYAQARGGRAAAAAFQERAAELTPNPERRAERALVAAKSKYEAGSPERALRLLAIAESGSTNETLLARVELLRAQALTKLTPGDEDLLLAAAKRLAPVDHRLARETYRDAFRSAQVVGRLGRSGATAEVARAILASPATGPANACDGILDGLATVIVEGHSAGAQLVMRALVELRDNEPCTEATLPWFPFASKAALDVWDDESGRALAAQMTAFARERGELSSLQIGLIVSVGHLVFAGDLAAAQALTDESALIAEATNLPKPAYNQVMLAAWRGQEEQVTSMIANATPTAIERGEGQWLTQSGWVESVLNNGLGRYDRALLAAEEGSRYPNELGIANWSMVELVEAAARSGQPERGIEAARRLSEMAQASRTDWIGGVAARSRALLADGSAAEDDYRLAIEHLERTSLRMELARARLVYGEWLRRQNRRVDAREQLRSAHTVLDEIGAHGFAARARRELAATGEKVHSKARGSQADMTSQEVQIARLAASGQTNPQIATQMFVSPRTVEWHMRKIFSKLGVTSRRDLPGALDSAGLAAVIGRS